MCWKKRRNEQKKKGKVLIVYDYITEIDADILACTGAAEKTSVKPWLMA